MAPEERPRECRDRGFAFRDSGLLRYSVRLGLRNMNNTAFQPVPPTRPGDPPRLLITWDAGIPWEIDTESLALVTPVGRRDQWTAEALGHQPFKIVFTTAHPAWDHTPRDGAERGQGFFVNYGKGVLGLMNGLPMVRDLRVLVRHLGQSRIRLMYDLELDRLVRAEVTARWLARQLKQSLVPDVLEGLIPKQFLRIKVWDGQSQTLKTLNVQHQSLDVEISESVHQLAVTRNHVVVMDTGFKVGLNTLYGDAIPMMKDLSSVIRTYTTRTVRPYATLHIVNRHSMDEALDTPPPKVKRPADEGFDVESFRIDLPVAACHFLADYYDDDNRIVVHVAHCDATDVSEWLRSEDKGVIQRDEVARELLGLPSLSGMDINRLARYTIDVKTRRVVETKVLEQEPETWTLALFAHRTAGRCAQPPEQYRSLFWCSMGFFEDFASGRLYGLYRNYIHRTVPVEGVRKMLELMGNQPATLFRVDTTRLEIVDSHQFPAGWVCSSPQFAPRAVPSEAPREPVSGWRLDAEGRSVDPELDGYLLVIAFGPDDGPRQRVPELQIFDAGNLAGGPICRMYHGDLVFGMSIHSAFLEGIGPRKEAYGVPVMDDLVQGQSRDVEHFLRAVAGEHFS